MKIQVKDLETNTIHELVSFDHNYNMLDESDGKIKEYISMWSQEYGFTQQFIDKIEFLGIVKRTESELTPF